MASQIQFYEKNKIDLSSNDTSITITDAVATNTGFPDYMRNRKNTSAWITTGSTDAAGTIIDVNMGSSFSIDTIILIGHNLKSYTIQYFNGAIYTDFSNPVSETVNVLDNNRYQFDATSMQMIRIVINSTQVVDADKIIKQLIITEELGQFDGWPEIKKPKLSTNKRKSLMLSGKSNVVESVGAFSCTLSVKNWKSDADLTLLETIFFKREGMLLQLNGFDEAQFSSVRMGYRNEDVVLVRAVSDYTPEWFNGLYLTGQKAEIKLEEVIA